MLVQVRLLFDLRIAAIVACVFQRELFVLRFDAAQKRTRGTIPVPAFCPAAFRNPAHEFIAIEMRIAAIGERSNYAVCERNQA